MLNNSYFLIILILYILLVLLILIFNSFFNKRYLHYLAIGDIFFALTIILIMLNNTVENFWIIKGFEISTFSCGFFFFYFSVCALLEIKVKVRFNVFCILFVITNFFAYSFFPIINFFMDKFILMSLIILFSLRILKHPKKNIYVNILALFSFILAFTQISYGIYLFVTGLRHPFFDNIIFVIYSIICAIIYAAFTIDGEKSIFNYKLKLLEEEVALKELKVKQLYEIDRVKNEYFANVSHELRTPINIIYSSLQLLEGPLQPGASEKYLTGMRENCYRLIRLVNNVIDMSKIECGRMDVTLQNLDVVTFVEDIVTSVVPFAEKKCISLIFDTEFEEKIIACDVDKMERILLNLLSNSIKFIQEYGEIIVYLYSDEVNLYISVKDNGEGIPEELHENIFNRFVQNKDSLHDYHQSSGIGLSLVKSLVEIQGGKITINRHYTEGCEFVIALPLVIHSSNTPKGNREITGSKLFIEFS